MEQLQKLPIKKENIEAYVNDAIGVIISGDVDPLSVELQLRVMEKTIAGIRKDVRVKNYVMAEAEKYNGQSFNGCPVKITDRRTADYSDDAEHTKLKAQLKARETLLKECGGVDPDTGEEVVRYKVSTVLNIKL